MRSSTQTQASPSNDPIEQLVAECLARISSDGTDAIEAVCAEHPEHYPVAFKYRWRSKDHWLLGTQYDREFYVNPGWGSDSLFQWIDAKTWFVGQLYP